MRQENRSEMLINAVTPLFTPQFLKSSEETAAFCERNSRETVDLFWNALSKVRETAEEKITEGTKPQYILFSHLYSSLFLKQYDIRLDIRDKGLYGTLPISAAYWNAGNLYRLFERDIDKFCWEVGWMVPRIRGYEMDLIRYAYAPFYNRMVKVFVQSMMEEVVAQEGFFSDLKILFGEYMGAADLIILSKNPGKG